VMTIKVFGHTLVHVFHAIPRWAFVGGPHTIPVYIR
jgi:hypothetical protein